MTIAALLSIAPAAQTVLPKGYPFHFLRHLDMSRSIIATSAQAAGQIGQTKETIEPYPMYIPGLRVSADIVSMIEQLEDATQDLIHISEQRLSALNELKKPLL